MAATCGWTFGGAALTLKKGERALAQELVGLAARHHPDRHDPGDRCPPATDADDPDRLCELWAIPSPVASSHRLNQPGVEYHRLGRL